MPPSKTRRPVSVTGQSGIGMTVGCCYFLFRLLALGQPVFFLKSRTQTLYFSSDGVQTNISTTGPSEDDPTMLAIEKAWVLIDINDEAEWSCPEVFATARCVIWTSSPREPRMKEFVKRFGAERWYMKTWSSKEIAAVAERFEMDRGRILRRMHTGGPVVRSLFPVAAPGVTTETLRRDIHSALGTNIFKFNGIAGINPVDCVLRIEPLVVIEASGRAHLQRTDCSTEFMSTLIEQITLDLLQNTSRFDMLQKQLAATFDIATTRTLAGKVVEALMYRSFERGIELPGIFSPNRTVGQTIALIGNVENLFPETAPTDLAAQRPLYLRPKSPNFPVVGAVVVTDNSLGFIQTSLCDGYSNYGLFFRILVRGAGVRM
ncbi:hypothetical protein B0H12DRAFT_135199 [Mycena haematopus]|nr:hypothetical protein B0H12DRAFT_135199 [Mycena haematopus]